MRKFPPAAHWHVDPKKAYDTFYCLTAHMKMSPQHFFDHLQQAHREYVRSDYCAKSLQQYNRHRLKGMEYLKTIGFSDLKAFEIIHQNLPKGVQLQLANSSTIRYNQLFGLPEGVRVFCNRGTSGIDGSTATAMGAAWNNEEQMVFITGDLSFFYDTNGLWHNYLKAQHALFCSIIMVAVFLEFSRVKKIRPSMTPITKRFKTDRQNTCVKTLEWTIPQYQPNGDYVGN